MDFHYELIFLIFYSFLSHIPTLFLKQLTTNITHMAITKHLENVSTTM